MNVEYKLLSEDFIDTIHTCWMRSFADYQIDMSYLTRDRMVHRAKMDRVDYQLSVGAFQNGEMIGFLLIGIDTYNDKASAFDAGTGIVPEFRGRGIAGSLFDFVLPYLQERGVKQILLEVLQDNEAAIKAYSKNGFSITRRFDCYRFTQNGNKSNVSERHDVIVNRVRLSEIEPYTHFQPWELSWEYNFAAMLAIESDLWIYAAYQADACIGYLVYNSVLQWVFALAVHKKYTAQPIVNALISHLLPITNAHIVKFNNVLEGNEVGKLLEQHQFEVYARQYEMRKLLN